MRKLLAVHPVEEGLICAWTVVEAQMSFEYQRSQGRGGRGLRRPSRKCLSLDKRHRQPVYARLHACTRACFPVHIQV